MSEPVIFPVDGGATESNPCSRFSDPASVGIGPTSLVTMDGRIITNVPIDIVTSCQFPFQVHCWFLSLWKYVIRVILICKIWNWHLNEAMQPLISIQVQMLLERSIRCKHLYCSDLCASVCTYLTIVPTPWGFVYLFMTSFRLLTHQLIGRIVQTTQHNKHHLNEVNSYDLDRWLISTSHPHL